MKPEIISTILSSLFCLLNAQMMCPSGEAPVIGRCQLNSSLSCPRGSVCREMPTNSLSYRTLCCRPSPTTVPTGRDKPRPLPTTPSAIRRVPPPNNISEEVCPSTSFRCGNGKCIPSAWICDNERDCPAGEDESEEHCKTCRPNHIRVCLPMVPLNGICVIDAQCLNRSTCIMNRCTCSSGLIHVNGDCQIGE